MLRLPAALHRSSSPYDGFLIDTLRPCNHRASAFPLRGCRLRQFSYTTGGSLSRFNRRRICTLDRQFIKLLLYLTELCETYQDVLPPVAPIPFEDQNTTRLIPFALRRLIRRSFGQCARAHHPRNWQPPLAARPRTTLPAPWYSLPAGSHSGCSAATPSLERPAFQTRLRWANHTCSRMGIEPSPSSTLTWTQNPPFYRDTRRCPLA